MLLHGFHLRIQNRKLEKTLILDNNSRGLMQNEQVFVTEGSIQVSRRDMPNLNDSKPVIFYPLQQAPVNHIQPTNTQVSHLPQMNVNIFVQATSPPVIQQTNTGSKDIRNFKESAGAPLFSHNQVKPITEIISAQWQPEPVVWTGV